MKKLFKIILFILLFSLTFYPVQAKQPPAIQEKGSEEIIKAQIRYYDTTDKKKVMKAILRTFQQEYGFSIQRYDESRGIIKAKREYKAQKTSKGFVVVNTSLMGMEASKIIANPFDLFNILRVSAMLDLARGLEVEFKNYDTVFTINASVSNADNKIKVILTIIEERKPTKTFPGKVIKYQKSGPYKSIYRDINKNFSK